MNGNKEKTYLIHKDFVYIKRCAGYDDSKHLFNRVINFLINPSEYLNMEIRFPKGVLLVGEPNIGKTTLIKYLNAFYSIPFLGIDISRGYDRSSIVDMFEEAKKLQKECVVIIDGIDLLEEEDVDVVIDEIENLGNKIIVVGVAESEFMVSPYLKKFGRFDKIVELKLPSTQDRFDILKYYVSNKNIDNDVYLDRIALETIGFNAAELENLVNEASISAVNNKRRSISLEDFNTAFRIIKTGGKKNITLSKESEQIIAFHEAGHVVAKLVTDGSADDIKEASIIPRGEMLGYTLYGGGETKYFSTYDEAKNIVICRLAGRVAEKIKFNKISTLPEDDLAESSELVITMLLTRGMDEKFGPISLKNIPCDLSGKKIFDDALVRTKEILIEWEKEATKILENNKELWERIAIALLEEKIIYREEIKKIAANYNIVV